MLLNKRAVRQLIKEENHQCTKDFLERLDREMFKILGRYCEMFGANRRLQGNIFDTMQLRIVFIPDEPKNDKEKSGGEAIDLG